MSSKRLTHLDDQGAAHMVDITKKAETNRVAVAEGHVLMSKDTRDSILQHNLPKGDAIATARIAAIMAAKKTSELIPLCHPLPIGRVSIAFTGTDTGISIQATVATSGKTGVEMEALTAVSIGALTLYDMAKALEPTMVIGSIRLLSKTGGKSGQWQRDDD